MATSHPKSAPSAADMEKVLSGIKYPKTRDELVSYASKQVSDKDLMDMINTLPSRIYRDSAEVAIALGEFKQGQKVRSAEEVAGTQAPSKKGGRAASATTSVSATIIAKVLSGVDFPKNKGELRDYAQRHMTKVEVVDSEHIINVIDRLPEKEYTNMADVEKSVGEVL
ncbi:MAG: DUF2795 domain-containing protein [Thermoproteota archaeon]|nr:DUF2795 domain-containing protein [Thermoproteota archaeon]